MDRHRYTCLRQIHCCRQSGRCVGGPVLGSRLSTHYHSVLDPGGPLSTNAVSQPLSETAQLPGCRQSTRNKNQGLIDLAHRSFRDNGERTSLAPECRELYRPECPLLNPGSPAIFS